jgi:hypothetical protein
MCFDHRQFGRSNVSREDSTAASACIARFRARLIRVFASCSINRTSSCTSPQIYFTDIRIKCYNELAASLRKQGTGGRILCEARINLARGSSDVLGRSLGLSDYI